MEFCSVDVKDRTVIDDVAKCHGRTVHSRRDCEMVAEIECVMIRAVIEPGDRSPDRFWQRRRLVCNQTTSAAPGSGSVVVTDRSPGGPQIDIVREKAPN